MKVRCLMMFRDEDDLLLPWVRHHGALFGYESLRLFDNGSRSPACLAAAAEAARLGARVSRAYAAPADFVAKGDLVRDHILEMDARDPADFYLPLDCDEFVGVRDLQGVCSFDRASVLEALTPWRGHQGVLETCGSYVNNPARPGLFRPSWALPKVFFARGACRELDHGFHAGVGADPTRPPQSTGLIHAHFHFKPFAALRAHARAKLAAFIDDLEPDALQAYAAARRPGSHLVEHLLRPDEADYLEAFGGLDYALDLPAFAEAMARADVRYPFWQAAG